MEILKNNNDFFTSVHKALSEIDENWDDYPGLIIVGTHAPVDVEEKLKAIQEVRERGIPILGICFGMQLLLIEAARNLCNLENANTTEVDPNILNPIITKLSDLRVGIKTVKWPDGSETQESHWHRYAFNKGYTLFLEQFYNLYFTGDILEIIRGKNIMGVQFHPEYQSEKGHSHPILKEFLELCRGLA